MSDGWIRKPGALLITHDALHGVCRSFEWIKTSAGWKIEREFLIQDELASRLDAAASEQERAELLEKEKLFVTDALVRSLDAKIESYTIRLDFDAALRCIQLQKAVAEKIGDQAGVAGAVLNFGMLKKTQDDYELALPPMLEALALFEAAGLVRGMAYALEEISYVYHSLGDHRQALDCAQKSLRLYQEAKHRRGIVHALIRLGNIYGNHNNARQALTYLEKALTIAQEIGDKVQIILLRHYLATQYAEIGAYEQALEIHQEILKQIEGYGDRGGAGMTRSEIGRVFAAQGRYAEALVYHLQAVTDLEAANKKGTVALELIHAERCLSGAERIRRGLASSGASRVAVASDGTTTRPLVGAHIFGICPTRVESPSGGQAVVRRSRLDHRKAARAYDWWSGGSPA